MLERIVVFRAAVRRAVEEAVEDPPTDADQLKARNRALKRRLIEELDDIERHARDWLPAWLPRSGPPGWPSRPSPMPAWVAASAAPRSPRAPMRQLPWPDPAARRPPAIELPPPCPLPVWSPESVEMPPTCSTLPACLDTKLSSPAWRGAIDRPRAARPSAEGDRAWLHRQRCAQALVSLEAYVAAWDACCADFRCVVADDAAWRRRVVDAISQSFLLQREADIWADGFDGGTLERFLALKATPEVGPFLFGDLYVLSAAAWAGTGTDWQPLHAAAADAPDAVTDALALVAARHVTHLSTSGGDGVALDVRALNAHRAAVAVAAHTPAPVLRRAAQCLESQPIGQELRRAWVLLAQLLPAHDQVVTRVMRPYVQRFALEARAWEAAGSASG